MMVSSLVLAAAGVTIALADATGPPAELAAQLQEAAKNTSESWNCSVSLTLKTADWEISKAYGTVDFGTGLQATVADEYAWGSVTKTLTGSNILKLVSEGVFGLDDEVMPHVDPFLKRYNTSMAELWGEQNVTGTTFRQVLHMVSGIPDFDTATPCDEKGVCQDPLRASLYATPSKTLSPIELLKVDWVKGQFKPCKPQPWGLFCYSSTNFMLLGMILAEHSGATSWETYNQTLSLPPALRKRVKFALRKGPSSFTSVHGYDRTQYNVPAGTHNNHDDFDVSGVFSGWTASDIVADASTVANLAWEIYGPPSSIAPKKYSDMMNPGENFYGLATHNLGGKTGRTGTKYGIAYGHLAATYGYQGLVAWSPALNFTLAVQTNIETDDQQQPAQAFCLAYNAALGYITGKKTSCTYVPGSYYSGGCKCTDESSEILV